MLRRSPKRPSKSIACALFSVLMISACQTEQDGLSPREAANLEKAIYCFNILENRPDLSPENRIEILRNECFAENFIEHAPHIDGGREAVLKVFANRYEKYPDLSMSIKRTASEGDLVWLHLHVKRTPDSLGGAAVHINRMKDGKFVEHWGVNQPVPENARNENTMF